MSHSGRKTPDLPIGASSSYREVLRMARSVGAKLERFDGATAIRWDPEQGTAEFGGLLRHVLGASSLWRYLQLCLRYLWLRLRIRKIVGRTGWAGIDGHPELCVPFSEWLERNQLTELQRLFELPVTTFGYGSLDEIPAPYVLNSAQGTSTVGNESREGIGPFS